MMDELSETERGYLLSGMAAGSVAMMLGRSQAWVERMRAQLEPPLPGLPEPPLPRLTSDPLVAFLKISAVLAFMAWARRPDRRLRKSRAVPGADRTAPRPQHHRVSRERLRALHAEGLNAFAISKRLAAEGVVFSDNSVRKALRRMGLLAVSKGRPPIADDKVDEIVRLYGEGLSSYEIAPRVGVDPSTVKRYLGLRGVQMRPRLPPKPKAPPRPLDGDELERLYAEHGNVARTAAAAHAPAAAVKRILKARGVALGPKRGPRRPRDKQLVTHGYPVAPAVGQCEPVPAGVAPGPEGGAAGENGGGAARPGREQASYRVDDGAASAPEIPPNVLRWCRQFRAARWGVADIAHLFDLDRETLRAAL